MLVLRTTFSFQKSEKLIIYFFHSKYVNIPVITTIATCHKFPTKDPIGSTEDGGDNGRKVHHEVIKKKHDIRPNKTKADNDVPKTFQYVLINFLSFSYINTFCLIFY